MFFIPSILITALTFPGVIIHELAHQLFCYFRKVAVYKVKYFQLENPSGYVVHENTDSLLSIFMISVGPFIVNTLLGALLLVPTTIEMNDLGGIKGMLNGSLGGVEVLMGVLLLLAYWLGFSILVHAFPSTGDAQVLIDRILKNKEVSIIARILVAPVVGLIYIGAIGSMFWLDVIYGVGISFLVRMGVNAFM